MLKEAIKHLQEVATKPNERIVGKDGRLFAFDNEGFPIELLEPAEKIFEAKGRLFQVGGAGQIDELPYREQRIAQETLKLHQLSGLVDYIKSNLERHDERLFLQIVDEKRVVLKGILNVDGNREELATAKAIIPQFSFDKFHSSEQLNIALQSLFIENEDRGILLKVIGNIVEENTKAIGDDGVSQSVTIKQGVTSREEVRVPNPVALAPFRTFNEVSQPVSKYVFRMRNGGEGALFEADGGVWRNDAIANIKEYLAKELQEEIESGRITILA